MIEGNKIVLRLFKAEELEEYVTLENNYLEQGEHLDPRFHSIASRRQHFDDSSGWWEEDSGSMAIQGTAGRLLGGISFFKPRRFTVGYEVGYALLRREDRGKGYGTEALRLFSAYLFDLKPIPRLQLLTAEGNVAARRIAEKCGYQVEGTFRKYWFVRGEYVTGVQYGLLREDCTPLSEVLDSPS
jgi:ribosomal-protein-alanine N-acetyltransferase